MIIKSLAHKTTNYENVINYVLSEYLKTDDSFALFHNVWSTDVKEAAKAFRENTKLKPKRKNGNVLYHEILSFSPLDSKNLTVAKIEDLVRKYIELRCPNCLVVAGLHRDKDHWHVHLMVSANEYLSSKAFRLSKAEFRNIKIEMERYQLKYPEIENSFVFLENKKKTKEVKKPKYKNEAKKEQLKDLVKKVFEEAKGKIDFIEQLKNNGLLPYDRNGELYGVWSEKNRFRLSGLGIKTEHIRTLTKLDDLSRLDQRSQGRGHELER